MAKTDRSKGGQISARAVINKIKIDSLPSFLFDISGDEIVPYGQDNLYPQRIFKSISKSPTGQGCVKRFREFVFGLGIENSGDVVVNRDGETLNDILLQSVRSYSLFNGFSLHFNFNILGDIVEIFSVDMRFTRKLKDLTQVKFSFWEYEDQFFLQDNDIIVDLYDPDSLKERIKLIEGGFDDYRGQIYYWSSDSQIYPTAQIDSASISASYEAEAQIYPYANIKNGFSGNTIIKYPSMLGGEDGKESEEVTKLSNQIEQLHGSENAGSSVVIGIPVNMKGEADDYKMIEHLSPTNVDDLFTNQNTKAENDILKVWTMPKILLGVSDSGMFNQASFNDAFNYKNADTEGDRRIIERAFDAFLPRTVFGIDEIKIVPLEMKEGDKNV